MPGEDAGTGDHADLPTRKPLYRSAIVLVTLLAARPSASDPGTGPCARRARPGQRHDARAAGDGHGGLRSHTRRPWSGVRSPAARRPSARDRPVRRASHPARAPARHGHRDDRSPLCVVPARPAGGRSRRSGPPRTRRGARARRHPASARDVVQRGCAQRFVRGRRGNPCAVLRQDGLPRRLGPRHALRQRHRDPRRHAAHSEGHRGRGHRGGHHRHRR